MIEKTVPERWEGSVNHRLKIVQALNIVIRDRNKGNVDIVSPDGSRWRIKVSNTGALTTVKL